MKIVYCIPSLYNSGGMERVLSLKASYFADRYGWDVTIITTSQKGRSNFYELSPNVNLIDLDIDYEAISKMSVVNKIMARRKATKEHQKKLSAVLHQVQPDITISMFTHEVSFLPSIKDGSKKVLELHFSKNFRQLDAQSKNASVMSRVLLKLAQIGDNKAIKSYDKFVVLTKHDAQDWNHNDIEVIPNPTPFENAPLCDYKSHKILAVGRLCPQKGFDMLIQAWALIPKAERDDWQIDIVGSGPYMQELKDLIFIYKLQESVNLLPASKDISKEYTSHSIFCFPSRYEGFGMTLMEAESHGLPSVAFDCPCGPSDLIQNGENGFLLPLGDVHALSKRTIELMQDENLRIMMGQKAQKFVSENLTPDIVMKKWESLFKAVIS